MTQEKCSIVDNKRLYGAQLPWVQVVPSPSLLCMLAPQEGIQILFINVDQMMVGFVCVLLKQLTNERLPCSESVEMVEPMLSVRIRSTDPDTESCSRRRLR